MGQTQSNVPENIIGIGLEIKLSQSQITKKHEKHTIN